MEDRSAQIATVCECIDHCFAFAIWCDVFARTIDPEDMVWGLDRGADLVSDATRLQSFLALRKLDDFLGGAATVTGEAITVAVRTEDANSQPDRTSGTTT